jgi:hypothetical protein
MNNINKNRMGWGIRVSLIGALMAVGAGPSLAAGCAQLYQEMSSAYAMEILAKSAEVDSVSARRFVKWRGWDLLASQGLDPLMATKADEAWGAEVAGLDGHPVGSGACVALAMRMEVSDAWGALARSEANQKAIDELGALNWSLAKNEVERQKAWDASAR